NDATLGALGLASYVGDRLIYRGRVGTGFSAEARRQILVELEGRKIETPATEIPADVSLTPVHPDMVVRVKFHGFTEDGHLRAAVFQGVRADVAPRDCTISPNDELTVSAVDSSLDAPLHGALEAER